MTSGTIKIYTWIKPIFCVLIFVLLASSLLAQDVIAKLKFEQAEEAFSKNDFKTTIERLNETERLLRTTNPKILYLRIMAEKGIIEMGNFDFDFLMAAKKHAQEYLDKNMNNANLEEKIREVYLSYEALQKYPSTKEGFQDYIKKPLLEKKRKADAAISFMDSLAIAYKFAKAISIDSFFKINPAARELKKRLKFDGGVAFMRRDYNDYKEGISTFQENNNILQSVTLIIKRYINPSSLEVDESRSYFLALKSRFLSLFPSEQVVQTGQIGVDPIISFTVLNPQATRCTSISISLQAVAFTNKYSERFLSIQFF